MEVPAFRVDFLATAIVVYTDIFKKLIMTSDKWIILVSRDTNFEKFNESMVVINSGFKYTYLQVYFGTIQLSSSLSFTEGIPNTLELWDMLKGRFVREPIRAITVYRTTPCVPYTAFSKRVQFF